jgi:hypothetical protein
MIRIPLRVLAGKCCAILPHKALLASTAQLAAIV